MIKSKKTLKDAAAGLAEPIKLPTVAGTDVSEMPIVEGQKPAIDPAVLAQVAEFQKALRQLKQSNPTWLVEMQEASRRIAENMQELQEGMRRAVAAYQPVLAEFARSGDTIRQAFAAYRPAFAEIARTGKECARIEAAGWLPHYTTPFGKLADCGEDHEAVGAVIAAHYAEEWPLVEASFLEHLSAYDIEDDAKATFAEALKGHGHGLYRLTARALFPEIERVVRTEVFEGALDEPITSQRELKRLAGHLGLQETQPGGMYAMALFRKLLKHLYEHAKTAEQLEVIAGDQVPNRHASLHGLLPYSSQQNSMNALIMTDFIFQILCALKRRAEDQERESSSIEF